MFDGDAYLLHVAVRNDHAHAHFLCFCILLIPPPILLHHTPVPQPPLRSEFPTHSCAFICLLNHLVFNIPSEPQAAKSR